VVKNGKSNNNRLRIRRVVDVPLREVSGICLRRGRNGRMFLIAVGDRVAKIAWFSQPRGDGDRIDWLRASRAEISSCSNRPLRSCAAVARAQVNPQRRLLAAARWS
jgi:hypothetical protein